MLFLDLICCFFSPDSPCSPRSAPSFNPNTLSLPVPASHSSLLPSGTRDAPNIVVFDSNKVIAGGDGAFPLPGRFLPPFGLRSMNGPFDFAKVALYLLRFPNLNFYATQPFFVSIFINSLILTLPPASSGVIIRVYRPFL